MEVHGVEERILVVGVNGPNSRHGVVDYLTTNELPKQALDALYCGCGFDGKGERDKSAGRMVPASMTGPPSRALSQVDSTSKLIPK